MIEAIDVRAAAAAIGGDQPTGSWPRSTIHVLRKSEMTEPFGWRLHAHSDETFLVVQGRLRIEFDDGAVELGQGEMLTVPMGARHRTAPVGARSVNLTFERGGATMSA